MKWTFSFFCWDIFSDSCNSTENEQCEFRQNIKWFGLKNCRIDKMRLEWLFILHTLSMGWLGGNVSFSISKDPKSTDLEKVYLIIFNVSSKFMYLVIDLIDTNFHHNTVYCQHFPSRKFRHQLCLKHKRQY